MSKTEEKILISALDIGTSKVVALVAEITDSGDVVIIGMGSQPSKGLKKGVIVNIDATVNAIQKSIATAEHMADCEIGSVCVGIAGSHICSFDSNGVVAINDDEVSTKDIERVIEAAKAVPMPSDQKILHILPQDFLIDGQGGITEPVGMAGVRLESHVHMVTGSVSAVQNIIKCVNRCGLDTSDMVLEQLASSYSVLSEDEKELGVCLVDIGGGTTDVAVFIDGGIKHTSVIPIAGAQVTSDIAHALRMSTEAAEDIKLQYGCALTKLVKSDDAIEIPSIADRPARRVPLQTLSGVIEARCEELLSLVYQHLDEKKLLGNLGAGIVLTGGASKMSGIIPLAEEIFRMPIRLGTPQHVKGLTDVLNNPMHATGVGLLLYSNAQQGDTLNKLSIPMNSAETIWDRMRNWFGKHF